MAAQTYRGWTVERDFLSTGQAIWTATSEAREQVLWAFHRDDLLTDIDDLEDDE